MAILATTHIADGNPDQAAEWSDRLSAVLAASPGFIFQVDTAAPDAPMAQSIAQVHQVITPQR